MNVQQLLAEIRPVIARTLIALDFDGTLAPIVATPMNARPAQGAGPVLTALARAGAQIALITGRDAATVIELSGLAQVPSLQVEGLYGLEQWRDGTLTTPPVPASILAATDEIDGLLRSTPDAAGVWVEDKRLSMVLHTRRSADPARAAQMILGPLQALAARVGLEVHPGNHVLELRVPGYDKGGALARLVQSYHPAAVLFAGDDLGDVAAFERVSMLRADGLIAWSVGVGDPPPPSVVAAADITVAGPDDVVNLLAALIPTSD